MNDNRIIETPFGPISIIVDGRSIPYLPQNCMTENVHSPRVLGRYRISLSFTPDGNEHSIACIFSPTCSYKRSIESGERLECQAFYNDQRFKMSIGTECDIGYCEGKRVTDCYDYDVDYLENGMSYIIFPDTETSQYVFGIAWIDGVGWDDPLDDEIQSRSAETWFGADPTIPI